MEVSNVPISQCSSACFECPCGEDFATRNVPPYVFVACLQDLSDMIGRVAGGSLIIRTSPTLNPLLLRAYA